MKAERVLRCPGVEWPKGTEASRSGILGGGIGFRVQGLGFRVGFRNWDLGFGFEV